MSATAIQRKLDKAHKKVSNKIGYTYNLYRPITNINPLDDANFIDDIKATFTLSDQYTSAMGWGIPAWTIYTDAVQVQEGDFFHSEELERTFFITSRKPHLPVIAIEVPHRVDIMRIGYGDTGNGFEAGATTYLAKNLPAFVSMGASNFASGLPARTAGTASMRTVEVITHFPNQEKLIGTTLVIAADGFEGDIQRYDYSGIGLGVKFSAAENYI